jgi:hypothetical protein
LQSSSIWLFGPLVPRAAPIEPCSKEAQHASLLVQESRPGSSSLHDFTMWHQPPTYIWALSTLVPYRDIPRVIHVYSGMIHGLHISRGMRFMCSMQRRLIAASAFAIPRDSYFLFPPSLPFYSTCILVSNSSYVIHGSRVVVFSIRHRSILKDGLIAEQLDLAVRPTGSPGRTDRTMFEGGAACFAVGSGVKARVFQST